jgi:hypothetical protein
VSKLLVEGKNGSFKITTEGVIWCTNKLIDGGYLSIDQMATMEIEWPSSGFILIEGVRKWLSDNKSKIDFQQEPETTESIILVVYMASIEKYIEELAN